MTDLAKLSAGALLPSPQDPDAMAWAKSFCAINPDCGLDEGVMVGWFANAMMAMHDHLLNTRTGQLVERDGVAGVAGVVDGVRKFLEMLEHGYAPFVEGALSAAMCCDGKMCGCRGASIGEYLAHLLRADTGLDRINSAALADLIADTADHPEPNYRGDNNV